MPDSLQQSSSTLAKFRYRWFFLYGAIVSYFYGGAVTFYLIEQYQPLTFDALVQNRTKCIGGHDGISAALYFTMSACSTIGFGMIYPCTSTTRVLSVLYSVVGLPLLLFVLADAGRRISTLVHDASTCFGQRGTSTHEDYLKMMHERSSIASLCTALLGFSLTLACITCCAFHYRIVEEWPLSDSVYFAFIAFINGDFQVTQHYFSGCVTFFFILLGFSILSTSIQLAQCQVKHVVGVIKEAVNSQISQDRSACQRSALVIDRRQLASKFVEEMLPSSMKLVVDEEKVVEDVLESIDRQLEKVQLQGIVESRDEEIQEKCIVMQPNEEIHRVHFECQHRPDVNDAACQSGVGRIPLIRIDRFAQAVMDSDDAFSQYENLCQKSCWVQTGPQQRSISAQFPKRYDVFAQRHGSRNVKQTANQCTSSSSCPEGFKSGTLK